LTATGASFTAVTLMTKVFVLLSMPPSATPPSSCTTTVTIALPLAFVAGVNVSTPALLMAGAALNNAVLFTVTV
jgi:uncharacterized membrane protein